MKTAFAFTVLFVFTLSSAYGQFFDSKKSEPVNITAGKTTYQWDIKKMVLLSTNNIRPYIIKGGSTIQADTIIYDSEKEIGYAFSNVVFTNPKKGMQLNAGQGIYYSKKQEVEVHENPVVKMDKDKTTAKSDSMIIYNERDYVVMTGNVEIRNASNLITGEKATYYTKTGKFIIQSNAKAIQSDLVVKGDRIDMTVLNGDIQSYLCEGKITLVNKKEGYNLTADKMDYDKKVGYTRLTGNPVVEITEAGTTNKTKLVADRIDLNTGTNGKLKSYTCTGNVRVEDQKEGYVIESGRLDYITERGYARITQNPVIRFASQKMTAYALAIERYEKEKKANLLGNVRIVQEGRTAYSRWAEYRTDTKKMVMTGNPIIVEGDSRWKTQKVVVDINTGVMNMVGTGEGLFQYQLK